jgi:hypothetical protein
MFVDAIRVFRSRWIRWTVPPGARFLHLELGDFAKIDDANGDFETRFIWNVLERTKVSAMSPGPRELTMWNTIEPLRDNGRIPFVSSNLTVKRGGILIVDPAGGVSEFGSRNFALGGVNAPRSLPIPDQHKTRPVERVRTRPLAVTVPPVAQPALCRSSRGSTGRW